MKRTFPFSRKVLDRANTIEFSTVELLANFDSTQGEVKAIFADNTFMKADYVFLISVLQTRILSKMFV